MRVFLISASLALWVQLLAAQGTLETTPPNAPKSSVRASEASLQPPRSLVHLLVGRWRFAIWFAGNFDGPPDASGTRVVEALYDDLRLQWTEELDNPGGRSQGFIGFDPRAGRFYSSSVHSEGSGAEFLIGTLSPSEPLVTFTPVAQAHDSRSPTSDRRLMESFVLTLIDQDHFTWVPLDRGWRAVFTRER
jgi:hypothetical protein